MAIKTLSSRCWREIYKRKVRSIPKSAIITSYDKLPSIFNPRSTSYPNFRFRNGIHLFLRKTNTTSKCLHNLISPKSFSKASSIKTPWAGTRFKLVGWKKSPTPIVRARCQTVQSELSKRWTASSKKITSSNHRPQTPPNYTYPAQ